MEFEALIQLCRLAIFDKSEKDFFNDLNELDADKFRELAYRHKVAQLAYIGLSHLKNSDVIFAAPFIENLKSNALLKTISNLQQTKELTRILNLFSEKGIVAIPYKGVVLAKEAYKNIGARAFSDIDLMVEMSDLNPIKDILIDQGYIHKNEMSPLLMQHFLRENCEFNFEFFQGGKRLYHIEPHWRIGQKMLQLNIDLPDLKQFITQKRLFTSEIDVFTPEGMLLTTCLHHFGKEQWLKLKHVCDVAAILNRFENEIDWPSLISLSENLKVSNLLFLGMGIAKYTFKMNLPPIVLEKLEQRDLNSLIEEQFLIIKEEKYQNNQDSVISRMKFHLKLRKSWDTKFKILYFHALQIIRPNVEDFKGEEISRWQYFLLFFKKPFRLMNSYFGKN